jgi:hypothetical protein
MRDGLDDQLIFRVAGVIEEGTLKAYWLWLEADDEYDGYNGTCVVQQLASGEYTLTLADERSSIPRQLTLISATR